MHKLSLTIVCCLAAGTPLCAVSKGTGAASGSAESLSSLLAKDDFSANQRSFGGLPLTAGINGLGRGDVQADLVRHEFIRTCGAKELGELAKRDGGGAFLKEFFANPTWIESFLISDPPNESYIQAAENLRLLHLHGEGLDHPIYRRLATAMALAVGKKNPYLLVERFGQIQRTHRDGLMHSSFDTLAVREMRMAIYVDGNAADYDFLVNDRQTRLGDYLGACWAVMYRSDNDYGDSIHGSWYYRPFDHGFPGWGKARSVGGVCGSLSKYGAAVARAHGIPAFPAGQPGHCAYVVRVGNEWPVGNYVEPPTYASAPGWDGTSYATFHRLYEPVSKDVPRLLAANRALWLARLQIDRKRPPLEWSETFKHAISAQPRNYRVWMEYADAMADSKTITNITRLDLARRSCKTFALYPDAAWALIRRFVEVALSTAPIDERAAFLLECHTGLRQDMADRYEGDWPFEGNLNWQVELLSADQAKQVEYFGRLLQIHAAKQTCDLFNRVLGWGNNRFAGNPKTAGLYAKEVESYFKSQGEGGKDSAIQQQIADGLRAAGKSDDLVSFRRWADMSKTMLPELKPADVHLDAKQASSFPECVPFPGELLSAKGLLKTSSSSRRDRPISYPALLCRGGFGGYFETNGEDNPAATVQLSGEGEVSGIVIADRYEAPSETERCLPMKVSVSVDAKEWKEVAIFNTKQPTYRVSLAGNPAKARFVKVERLPGRKDPFHLRNILVFGKPLY